MGKLPPAGPSLYAERVLAVVELIPAGKVLAYGDVAEYLGESSARAVGRVMFAYGAAVPWHRVVMASGRPAPPKAGTVAPAGAGRDPAEEIRRGGRHGPRPLGRAIVDRRHGSWCFRCTPVRRVARRHHDQGGRTRALAAPKLSHLRGQMRDVSTPTVELARAPLLAPAEVDDDRWQRAVIAHRDGPLLVLAGPGTGKTTTLVEAVAARVDEGARPEQVLVLTFSRKAAGELRDRITARLGRTTATPAAWTFHAFCYALLREHQDPLDYGTPLRLLSGPEQDVAVRELLRGDAEMGTVAWPPQLQVCPRPTGRRSPTSWRSTSTSWTLRAPSTTPNWCTAPASSPAARLCRRSCGRAMGSCSSTSTRTCLLYTSDAADEK